MPASTWNLSLISFIIIIFASLMEAGYDEVHFNKHIWLFPASLNSNKSYFHTNINGLWAGKTLYQLYSEAMEAGYDEVHFNKHIWLFPAYLIVLTASHISCSSDKPKDNNIGFCFLAICSTCCAW